MVLFNWGWSRLINKLSLIRRLNLFALEARISKWSKSIEQLHSSSWSATADCLTHLRRFPVKLEIPMCFAALVKKWRYVLTPPYISGFLQYSRIEQKQPSRGVLRKSCSEDMQQIYRRTPMPKCGFNTVAMQLYWNHTSTWVFSCKCAAYFQNTFS